MITDLVCSNGVVLKYDPTIKEGDLITGYHKGFWIVTKVTPRPGNTPHIEYRRIDKKVTNGCDASYCRKVDPEALRREMIDEANKLYDKLMQCRSQ
jgi:hypothetical protein